MLSPPLLTTVISCTLSRPSTGDDLDHYPVPLVNAVGPLSDSTNLLDPGPAAILEEFRGAILRLSINEQRPNDLFPLHPSWPLEANDVVQREGPITSRDGVSPNAIHDNDPLLRRLGQ